MTRFTRCTCLLAVLAAGGLGFVLGGATWGKRDVEAATKRVALEVARIFIEYNSTDEDLGFHVFLDGEDWKTLRIINPNGTTIFEVAGKGGFGQLGLTELFFEGAEPPLSEVPLADLLALFPEGRYRFQGTTAADEELVGVATLTHAVPAGPSNVEGEVNGNTAIISWDPVTDSPEGFPDKRIDITGYQVIVGTFQVILPASATSATLSPEFVASLASGPHDFEVLAIEAGGNQTITSGSFSKP